MQKCAHAYKHTHTHTHTHARMNTRPHKHMHLTDMSSLMDSYDIIVIFDPYEYHMDLYNKLCTSAMAKALMLDITPKFAIKFSHTCHAYRHRCTIYTTLSDLDVCWGSQGQRKAKPLCFIFLLIRIKSDVVLKQFKLNFLILF